MKATIDREATADPQPMAERLAALERMSATQLRSSQSGLTENGQPACSLVGTREHRS